jgi:hypothetical protein
MRAVARAAEVSEATAYRYFSDLVSPLEEAMVGLWPVPVAALEPLLREQTRHRLPKTQRSAPPRDAQNSFSCDPIQPMPATIPRSCGG